MSRHCGITARHDRRLPDADGRRAHRGFSLLELMIAVGVLGIGLVMVAAIFPVALDQHRTSTHEATGALVAANARAIVLNWSPPQTPTAPPDTRVYLYPFTNFSPGGGGTGFGVIRALNGGYVPAPMNIFSLADIIYPPSNITGTTALDRQIRYTWMAFFRKIGSQTDYTVLVCVRAPNEQFALQDTSSFPVGATPPTQAGTIAALPSGSEMALPMPWRLRVQTDTTIPRPKRFVLASAFSNISPDRLIARGSVLLSEVTGQYYTVLKVTWNAIRKVWLIDVLEDVGAEPDSTTGTTMFDLWFVPGAVTWSGTTASFDTRSPVVAVSSFSSQP